jgi:hypothetical protein
MPRGFRIDTAGALHQIMVRDIERGAVFRNDVDRDQFLERLGGILQDIKTLYYAWALIPGGYQNSGPLENLENYWYWSSTETVITSEDPNSAFTFGFSDSRQIGGLKDDINCAWAVRNGDVPIPGTVWLLGSLFIGAAGLRRKFRTN